MQLINILGAAALLSSSVLAAPQNQKFADGLRKRGDWDNGGHPAWPFHGHHQSHTTESSSSSSTTSVSAFSSLKPVSHKTKPHHHHSAGTGLPWFPTNSSSAPYSPTGTGSPIYSNSSTITSASSTSACTVPVSTVYVTISTTSTSYIRPISQNSTSFAGTGTGASTGFITTSSSSAIFSNSTTTTPFSSLLPVNATSSSLIYTNTTTTPCPSNNMTSSTPFSSLLPANTTTSPNTENATPPPVTTPCSTSTDYITTNATVYTSPTSNLAPVSHTKSKKTKTRTKTMTLTSMSATASSSPTFIPASDCSSTPGVSSTSSYAQYPSTTISATTIISGIGAPSGTPIPKAKLCNVHGFPIGDFFLGQYVESAADVDVSLFSCYEFCVTQFNMGCKSIDFYPEPGTGAPRCDLYSGSVSQSLDMIIPEVPNTWYDVGCVVTADM